MIIIRSVVGLGILIAIAAVVAAITIKPVTARSLPIECRSVVVLYARGSGQASGHANSFAWRNALQEQIGESKMHFVELESFDEDGYGQYSAFSPLTGLLAKPVPSWGLGGIDLKGLSLYQQSVNGGKDLAFNIIDLSPLIKSCPETRLVLSGYSQGAQVMGELTTETRMKPYLNRISFMALFGDPKLNHGTSKPWHVGATLQPAPWLRGEVYNSINMGYLDARVPYLPNEMAEKTGSWCFAQDMICNSAASITSVEKHRNYDETYYAPAAAEAATHIFKDTGTVGIAGQSCGMAKQDVVLLLDMNDSIQSDPTLFLSEDSQIAFSNPTAPLEERLLYPLNIYRLGCNVRASIISFGDELNSEPAGRNSFTHDRKQFANLFLSKYDSSKRDVVRKSSNLLSALKYAISSEWRLDSQKSIFIVSNRYGENWDTSKDINSINQNMETFKNSFEFKDIIHNSLKEGVKIHALYAPQKLYGAQILGYDTDLQNHLHQYFSYFTSSTAGGLFEPNACNSRCNWEYMQFSNIRNSLYKTPITSSKTIKSKAKAPLNIQLKDLSNGLIESIKKTDRFNVTAKLYCGQGQEDYGLVKGIEFTIVPTLSGECNLSVESSFNNGSCIGCTNDLTASWPKHISYVDLHIDPVDYVSPPPPSVPSQITQSKNGSTATISWKPSLSSSSDPNGVEYIIRDGNGDVLNRQAETSLSLTNIESGTPVPYVTITAIKDGYASEPVSNTGVITLIPSPLAENNQTNPSATVAEYNDLDKSQTEVIESNQNNTVVDRADSTNSLSTPTDQLSVLGDNQPTISSDKAGPNATLNSAARWSADTSALEWMKTGFFLLLGIVVLVIAVIAGRNLARKSE